MSSVMSRQEARRLWVDRFRRTQIVFLNRAIRHSERRHNALCFFQLALLAGGTNCERRHIPRRGRGARPTRGSFALSSGEARAALEPSSFEKSAWTKLRHLTCGASRRISQHLITARKLVRQCVRLIQQCLALPNE